MCLTTCLCAQIARTPFNYTITARTLLIRLTPQFPPLGKNYRIASMLIITRALSTPRDDERRVRGSMFCETNQVRTNRVESMKTQRWKVPWPNNEIDSFCSRIIAISLVSCLHHTCALGNLILRCLTGSHIGANRREGFKAMNAKVIVLLKRDLNFKLRLISNEDWGKKVWIIRALA